jgi:hypothetical protein
MKDEKVQTRVYFYLKKLMGEKVKELPIVKSSDISKRAGS